MLSVNNLLLAQEEYVEVPGCRNPLAINYDINATVDDGSCEFPTPKGCKNPDACNYNPHAQVNDRASCEYSDQCGVCDSNPDNDCVQDCSGEWGGDAIEDCTGGCNGDAIEDCAGVCDGNAIEDCAGVCSGDAIEDCSGKCDGNTVIDECGVCDGPGKIYDCGCTDIKSGYCDCSENILDCADVCGGSSMLDNCGTCDMDSSNDCIQNCNGGWGDDSYTLDEEGNCCKTEYQQTWYIDSDSDGLGEISQMKNVCFGTLDPDGFVLNSLDCYDEFGVPAGTDKCGICNPDVFNESCTGCMNPLALNFNEDCYYYSGDIFPSERIDECLFDDNSCYFDYFECCGDPSGINYKEDCNFYNNDSCIYGFDILSNKSEIAQLEKLYDYPMKFETVHFLNLFSFDEKVTNANYNNFIQDAVNRYSLIGNQEYLFSGKPFFLDPKNLLKNRPIYTDMKLGQDKNTFLMIEYYKTNLENVADRPMSLPTGIKIEDYFEMMLYKMQEFLFREYVINSYTPLKPDLGDSGSIVLYSNDFFSIELKGSISISGSLSYIKQEQELAASQNNNDDINLNINQTQQFTLSAYIGDRLSITANQNSQSDFEWENALKIMYKGYENEVVQEVSIGNINLSLASGTLASVSGGSSGLFGAKLVTQFGPLTLTSVLGREKAIKNSKTFESGGSTHAPQIISDYNFLRNKYFFIDTQFKKDFYPFISNNTSTPIDDPGYDINEIILFKKKNTSAVYEQGLEPGIAYVDIDGDSDDDENIEEGSWSQLVQGTDYRINKQLGFITLLGNSTSEYIAAHYNIINNNNSEVISSGTRVMFDECLRDDNDCCASIENEYCHKEDTSDYEAGIDYIENNLKDHFQGQDECLTPSESNGCENNDTSLIEDVDYKENNGDEGYQNTVLYLKLIKDGSQTSASKTWHLMFKNVYYLGARDIDRNSLTIDIVYKGSVSGEDIISSNGNSFSNIFGIDKKNESGIEVEGGDGKVDTDNSWILDLEDGEIWFPFHMPFSYNDPLEPFEDGVVIEFNLGGETILDTLDRYWGNPHEDLEDVFQKDLDGLQEDEAPLLYQNYTQGPSMYYDNTLSSSTIAEHRFAIEVQHSSSSSTISLGFMIIENSETVLLNGSTRLIKGSDYSIDYFSGNLTLLSPRAIDPSAEITITYDQNELVSFDQKILAGSYIEYKINDFTDAYGGLYYYSQTLAEEKVDVGYEPMQNILWHIGANYQKDFKELTNRINQNTNLDFTKDVSFRIGAEFAQVFPNPNPLGKAYIDDFESSKLVTSITPSSYNWKLSSSPDDRDDMHKKNRVDMYYYGPHNQVKTQDIWPNIEVTTTANNQTTRTLWLELDRIENMEIDSEYLTDFSTGLDSLDCVNIDIGCQIEVDDGSCILSDDMIYWNGITYALNKMNYDQTKNKYVDIWMNVDESCSGDNCTGRISDRLEFHIDLGIVSEDINGSGEPLDTEDIPIYGYEGNGLLDQGEDVGLDGCEDIYEDGWGGCLNSSTYCDPGSSNINNYIDCAEIPNPDPNRDNYSYQSNSDNYSRINGTENNGSVRKIPDTEDLNGNGALNNTNRYYTVSFFPNDQILNYNNDEESYIELESGTGKNWKLYRIPIQEFVDNIGSGDPSFSEIKHMRIRLSTNDLSTINKIKIAKIEIVGNVWQEVGLIDSDEIGNLGYDGTYIDSDDPVLLNDDISIEVVNNEEDSNYSSPPGVSGEYNEYQGRFSMEQALSINFESDDEITGGIERHKSYFINKITGYSTMNSEKRNSFFTYKNLEMFVQGSEDLLNKDNVEYCLRLGRENNYYEIRHPFLGDNSESWDQLKLSLESLSRYKYDNIDNIEGSDTYEDVGSDGCSDEYETGLDSPYQCIPQSEQNSGILEEICSYNYTCSQHDATNCELWVDYCEVIHDENNLFSECRNIEYHNLFNPIDDEGE